MQTVVNRSKFESVENKLIRPALLLLLEWTFCKYSGKKKYVYSCLDFINFIF